MPLFAKLVLVQIAILLISWFTLFNATLISLVNSWSSSDTFQHCYIIAPISLWLMWRRRFMLAEVHYKPVPLLLIPVLLSSLLWFAGSLTGIQIAAQFAVISWLFFAVWALLGHDFFRVGWFPLCYLFFMVPIGDEIVPQLQIFTADISVFLLASTGIPVFREGLYLAIPNGMFEVAVACSGIRYLIASVALGTLFAHLQYHSLKRQLLFLAIAAILPVIANGIRAYFIVLIAYISDMKLATGVDHLLYGWVFFGIVMFLLFWVGNYWRQSMAEPPSKIRTLGAGPSKAHSYSVLLASLIAAISITAYETNRSNQPTTILAINTNKLPNHFQSGELSSWRPNFVNADDYYEGIARGSAPAVEIYIALYSKNIQEQELVNYHNQFFDRDHFTPIKHRLVDNGEASYGEYQITSTTGDKFTLYYWYQLPRYRSANATEVKLNQSWRTLTSGRDSGAIVILATRTSSNSKTRLKRAMVEIQQVGNLWETE
ncbi:exosortase A [Neiella marina]|uniref:Exosortase A n=1 Tax=Neiella holothuriorum TaxID=2870530 RepID=A0ABS7EH25_9GAMM|nr:exosortase A [Neiella holothuriorum]MBW8191641.1 exosortase A [Neiella holothuriorum]